MIRRAVKSDVTQLAALVEQYWACESIAGFHSARITALLESVIEQPARAACWVAQESGRLNGYLLAVFLFSLEHGGEMAEIDEFFVVAAHRGCGVGSALLSAARDGLATRGIVRLQLQVAADSAARSFYRRHGFESRAGYELFEGPLRRPAPSGTAGTP